NGEQSQPDRIEKVPGNDHWIGELGLELRDFIWRRSNQIHYVLKLLSTQEPCRVGNMSRLESTEVKKGSDEDRHKGRGREHIKRDRCQRAILLLEHYAEAAAAVKQVCGQGQQRHENDCDRQNRSHALKEGAANNQRAVRQQ